MGYVFLSRDTKRNPVALKVPGDHYNQKALHEQFRQEAKILQSLNHPNIVKAIAVGQDIPYIVMEFLGGKTLAQRIGQKFSPEQVTGLITKLASALDYMHSQGVVHRDVKPGNIMFRTAAGLDPVFVDFGIVQVNGETVFAGAGAAGFKSPEQHNGMIVDGRSDQYSLAVVTWLVLTCGVDPKPAGMPQDFPADWSDSLKEVFRIAFSPVATDRFATCGEFAAGLAGAFNGIAPRRTDSATRVPGHSPTIVTGPARRSNPQAVLIILLLALFVTVFLLRRIMTTQNSPAPSISSVQPGAWTAGSPVKISVEGIGFQPGLKVAVLNSGGARLEPTDLQFPSATSLSFSLPIAPGSYRVSLERGAQSVVKEFEVRPQVKPDDPTPAPLKIRSISARRISGRGDSVIVTAVGDGFLAKMKLALSRDGVPVSFANATLQGDILKVQASLLPGRYKARLVLDSQSDEREFEVVAGSPSQPVEDPPVIRSIDDTKLIAASGSSGLSSASRVEFTVSGAWCATGLRVSITQAPTSQFQGPVQVRDVSAESFVGSLPSPLAGTYKLQVLCPSGSTTMDFTVRPAPPPPPPVPVIYSLLPDRLVAAPETRQIGLNGSNFRQDMGLWVKGPAEASFRRISAIGTVAFDRVMVAISLPVAGNYEIRVGDQNSPSKVIVVSPPLQPPDPPKGRALNLLGCTVIREGPSSFDVSKDCRMNQVDSGNPSNGLVQQFPITVRAQGEIMVSVNPTGVTPVLYLYNVATHELKHVETLSVTWPASPGAYVILAATRGAGGGKYEFKVQVKGN